MRRLQSVPDPHEEDAIEEEYPCTETFEYQEIIDRLKRTGEIEVRDEEY
jgi:hypothetical protein